MSVLLRLLKWRLALHRPVTLAPSLPPFSSFTAALFMLISKCVSAAVLTPARCQGQTRKETGFDGEPLDKKHPLMEHYAA